MKLFEETVTIDRTVARAVALGNFDGLHRGHQQLIRALAQISEDQKLESCVYTFKNHTLPTIKGQQPSLITTLEEKGRLLEAYAIDCLILDDFNQTIMNLSPEEFVQKILIEALNCRAVVIGFDYHFGARAKGDAALMKELGARLGIQVCVIDPVMVDGEKVSSTAIRNYMAQGRMDRVNEFLGRYFSKRCRVIQGKGNGHQLGFPTANLEIGSHMLIPQEGVYATLVEIGGRCYQSATSIGTNPTFHGTQLTVETHVIDFEGDLYGQIIEVFFVERLRGNVKFDGKPALQQQLKTDVETCREILQPLFTS